MLMLVMFIYIFGNITALIPFRLPEIKDNIKDNLTTKVTSEVSLNTEKSIN